MRTTILIWAIALTVFACHNRSNDKKDLKQIEQTSIKKQLSTITFPNEYYYTDGKFDKEKAKDAIIALLKYHDYPVFDNLRESLWVSDYGTGQFAKLGLAALPIVNNEQDLYMLQDLFLMPGQMLPEHWHEIPANLPLKMEAWFVRNGSCYIAGAGENNMGSFPEIVIPQCHMDGTVTVKSIVKAGPGSLVKLSQPKSRHWQFAGEQGVIESEVANVHSGIDVRHSDTKVNDNFLGK